MTLATPKVKIELVAPVSRKPVCVLFSYEHGTIRRKSYYSPMPYRIAETANPSALPNTSSIFAMGGLHTAKAMLVTIAIELIYECAPKRESRKGSTAGVVVEDREVKRVMRYIAV